MCWEVFSQGLRFPAAGHYKEKHSGVWGYFLGVGGGSFISFTPLYSSFNVIIAVACKVLCVVFGKD